jgi:tRNA (guanine-N7-)-methyltransferase
MTPGQTNAKSARYIPSDWIHPLDLTAVFGRPARPLDVDLGCGRGRFLLARARTYPDTCFLGIERLLARVGLVDRRVIQAGLTNVRLLYADAAYAVRYLLPAGSVRTFFILFSDPWPKRRHESKRLFQPDFLEALTQALEPGGAVHVASDHQRSMSAVAKLFAGRPGFVPIPPWEPKDEERTDYEVKYLALNRVITRLSYQKFSPNEAP